MNECGKYNNYFGKHCMPILFVCSGHCSLSSNQKLNPCCVLTQTSWDHVHVSRFKEPGNSSSEALDLVKHWNRLPVEVLEALSLETVQVRLDQVLSSLT